MITVLIKIVLKFFYYDDHFQSSKEIEKKGIYLINLLNKTMT